MKTHPSEAELALLAGGECSSVSRFFLNRHVRRCDRCLDTIAEFAMIREDLADESAVQLPGLDWDRLADEMRANINLGLEAGECVRTARPARAWNPRLAAAFASLILLAGAGFLLRAPHIPEAALPTGSILESSGTGLQLRNGANSLMLLNHHGSVADQTVSAQGVIRASYVDPGGVTTNSVYLE